MFTPFWKLWTDQLQGIIRRDFDALSLRQLAAELQHNAERAYRRARWLDKSKEGDK